MPGDRPEIMDPAAEGEAAVGENGCARKVVITHTKGLHLRPSTRVSAAARKFQCDVRIRANGRDVSAKSIIELMGLAAEQGTELSVRAEGKDAAEAVNAIVELVRTNFGFGPDDI